MNVTEKYESMGLRQVSCEEFYAAVKADPRDIMCFARYENKKLFSEWRENNKPWAPLWGITDNDEEYEGYPKPDRYWLAKS